MTTTKIHPTAIVDPTAVLHEGVEIGPYTIIGPNVELGAHTRIGSHVVIGERTITGEQCFIDSFAAVGGEPQDFSYKGESTRVRIGDRTTIREYTTVNRATGEGQETVIGSDCMLMEYVHVAHNCQIGNHVIMVNTSQIAGYVELGDYAYMSALTILHQFVKVGRFALLSGATGSRQDLPPFTLLDGRPAAVRGVNKVGLKRRGVGLDSRTHLTKAVKLLFQSGLTIEEAVSKLAADELADPYVDELLTFIKTSKRGVYREPFNRTERDKTGLGVDELTV
ncbi:MAG: acyl-ACP--UDP-N-acetylglucosamine O-acyltransferase [Cyanobacteria bacterium HKST-UBA06]|nr:acyl-ACP--UDP-N-acetylglucosamine O-acyltransferase [Cyanobacteria bacterium HKST-UBA06]